MTHDLDAVTDGWEFRPDGVTARLARARDGREVVQMRLELGVLQMEAAGRPDGRRPHGFDSYFAYLADRAAREADFTLDEDQCREADREFMQLYQRRICWMALRRYDRAIADADHTLAFMDLLAAHSPSEEVTNAHERYRPFVLFHRTQSSANERLDAGDPEGAVASIREGLERIRQFYARYDLEEGFGEDGLVQQLRRLERSLKERHSVGVTLEERLAAAVAAEDYEQAARLRDALAERRTRTGPAAGA